MSRWIALVFLSLAAMSPVCAHDIGISQVELAERERDGEYAYILRVAAGALAYTLFPSPELPPGCAHTGDPRGARGTAWKSFEFACSRRLGPDDVLVLPWMRDGVMLRMQWSDGSELARLFKHDTGKIEVRFAELRASSDSPAHAARRYTLLGIEHILEGVDHLLFVFALLLMVGTGWSLIKTITAFTVAHSITLGLATLGFVHVPSRPVEASIALSIVLLARELLEAQRGRFGLAYRSTWLVAFAFGLLHGFGFAGALSEVGLPEAEVPIALLFFNVGVELGQLLFVAAVIVLGKVMRLVRNQPFAPARAIAAYLIGVAATFWFFERLGSMFLPA